MQVMLPAENVFSLVQLYSSSDTNFVSGLLKNMEHAGKPRLNPREGENPRLKSSLRGKEPGRRHPFVKSSNEYVVWDL